LFEKAGKTTAISLLADRIDSKTFANIQKVFMCHVLLIKALPPVLLINFWIEEFKNPHPSCWCSNFSAKIISVEESPNSLI
jgi:hypothetical protein